VPAAGTGTAQNRSHVPRFAVWLGGRPTHFTSTVILWKAIEPWDWPLTRSWRVARCSSLSCLRVVARFNTAVYGLVHVEIAVRLLTVTEDLWGGFDPCTKVGHQCASSSVWNRNEKHDPRLTLPKNHCHLPAWPSLYLRLSNLLSPISIVMLGSHIFSEYSPAWTNLLENLLQLAVIGAPK